MADQVVSCTIAGNSDLYGLGIRLGVYFQWLSTFFISIWYPEGRNDLYEAYAIFLVAVVIALLAITPKDNDTNIVDVFILSYIIFGGAMASMNTISRVPYKESTLNSITIYTVMGVAGAYYIWFWAHGISADFAPSPCGTYGFLFAKVSLFNEHVRGFLGAVSVYPAGAGVVYLISLLMLSTVEIGGLQPWYGARVKRMLYSFTGRSSAAKSSDTTDFVIGLVMWAAIFIYTVLGVELTLWWNHVDGVYTIKSTGQLIPFIIGLVGLAKVVYEPMKTRFKARRPDTSIPLQETVEEAASGSSRSRSSSVDRVATPPKP